MRPPEHALFALYKKGLGPHAGSRLTVGVVATFPPGAEEARWWHLQANAKQPTIGKLIDDAMLAIEGNNALLKWVLPKLISGEIRLREAEEAMA